MQSEYRTVYLDNEATILFIYWTDSVTPRRFNKRLLTVDGEFFLSLSC